MSALTRRPPLSLVVVLAIAGFLVVTTGFATTAAGVAEEPRKSAVIDQILERRKSVDGLDDSIVEVRSEIETAQRAIGQQNAAARDRQVARDRLAEAAGTTALKGSALVVRVADAPAKEERSEVKGSTPTFGTDRVQDDDLQLVVNALFASGAEAIAVNDNRVSAVTPIRAAGGTIVVNYRPVSSPYRVVAIGARKADFERTVVAQNFRQWKDEFELGYSVSSSKNQTVPAYAGRVAIDTARALPTSESVPE